LNKCDRKHANFKKKYDKLKLECKDIPIIPVSAREGTNLELLLETVKQILKEAEEKKVKEDHDLQL
jgi:predicted GTPase